jgi:predicted dehydrogenase
MEKINIGIIGAGFAANLHGDALKKVAGFDIRITNVADIHVDAAQMIAEKYGSDSFSDDYRKVLDDDKVDVVIICTPPSLHAEMIEEALDAGKHVICEKPLTGYFGEHGDPLPIGDKVPKRKMYNKIVKDLEVLEKRINSSKKLFMYAENYVYTPSIQKAAEILEKKKSKILFMRGEESVQGSPSGFAGNWDKAGGGTLLRIGCHPLAGILYLKGIENRIKGCKTKIKCLTADVGRITNHLDAEEKKYLRANPVDVEDFGTVTMTFSDDTKATVFANDNVVGGIKNYVEIYCNDSVMYCNITPADSMRTYFLDEIRLENVYISEKLDHKTGWNNVFVSESVQRGYVDQMQDFIECVTTGREPLSNYKLARDILKVIYAAYISAEEGRNIDLEKL